MAYRIFTPSAAEELLVEIGKQVRARAEAQKCNVVLKPWQDETGIEWDYIGEDLITEFDSLKIEVQIQQAQDRDELMKERKRFLEAIGLRVEEDDSTTD